MRPALDPGPLLSTAREVQASCHHGFLFSQPCVDVDSAARHLRCCALYHCAVGSAVGHFVGWKRFTDRSFRALLSDARAGAGRPGPLQDPHRGSAEADRWADGYLFVAAGSAGICKISDSARVGEKATVVSVAFLIDPVTKREHFLANHACVRPDFHSPSGTVLTQKRNLLGNGYARVCVFSIENPVSY